MGDSVPPAAQDLNGVAAKALASALLPAYPRPAAGAPAASPPRPAPGAGGAARPAQAAAQAAQQQGPARVLGRVPMHPLGDLTAHLTAHPR